MNDYGLPTLLSGVLCGGVLNSDGFSLCVVIVAKT